MGASAKRAALFRHGRHGYLGWAAPAALLRKIPSALDRSARRSYHRINMDGTENGGGKSEQTELLRSIWTEMKAVKAALEAQLEATRRELGSRIDQTNERLDAVRGDLKTDFDGLRQRLVESEVRLGTATTGLSGDVRELSALIRDWREEHRTDRADLRARVLRIEEHLGLTHH
jgi:hypothetical protein